MLVNAFASSLLLGLLTFVQVAESRDSFYFKKAIVTTQLTSAMSLQDFWRCYANVENCEGQKVMLNCKETNVFKENTEKCSSDWFTFNNGQKLRIKECSVRGGIVLENKYMTFNSMSVGLPVCTKFKPDAYRIDCNSRNEFSFDLC
ncbi:hypothetical protein BGW38_007902 [Lunasporangiospora selenospora]|uniref:CVNH domain-containing protein n=1 Tax=Lunasporangiospora selenospora TaxID=979761 RepID=A0A9P6FLY2_9FUNG|nr:hypothetical protein BGW38_007902 [Lunasporangiospora selenospora]